MTDQLATLTKEGDVSILTLDDGKANGVIKRVDFAGAVKIVSVELKNGETIRVSGSPHSLWTPGDSVKITAKRYLCYDSAGNRLSGFSSGNGVN